MLAATRYNITFLPRRFLVVVIPALLILGAFVLPGCRNGNGEKEDRPAEYSIQEKIDKAENGETIEIDKGTYRETIDFQGKNLTLRSKDPENPEVVKNTVIKGNNGRPAVIFQSGENEAVLEGFTISTGEDTAGEQVAERVYHDNLHDNLLEEENHLPPCAVMVTNHSSPSIKNNVITANPGTGISIDANSSPTVAGNLITRNSRGGIIVLNSSSPVIKDNEIKNNYSSSGAGIKILDGCTPLVDENRLAENHAQNRGGAIAVGLNSSPQIENNTISNNTAGRGGGIGIYMEASPTLHENLLENNEAEKGGAVWVCRESDLELSEPDSNIYSRNEPGNIKKQEEIKDEDKDTEEETEQAGFYKSNGLIKYQDMDLMQKSKDEIRNIFGEPEGIDSLMGSILYSYPDLDFRISIDPHEEKVDAVYITGGKFMDIQAGMTFSEIEEEWGKADETYFSETEFQEYVNLYHLDNYTVRFFAGEQEAPISYIQIQKK